MYAGAKANASTYPWAIGNAMPDVRALKEMQKFCCGPWALLLPRGSRHRRRAGTASREELRGKAESMM